MFEKTLCGRVFLFGKNVDTDQIYPGRFVELTDIDDVAKHAMEGADPEFAAACGKGDILVAGGNFGCGSSREHAADTLKAVGVGAVVAPSFGRIFYRNGINLGLPLLVCPDLHSRVTAGERISIDVKSGEIRDESGQLLSRIQPVTGYMMHILESGGIKPLLRGQFQ
ncbi:MAG: 3-isopropylmalate dehydratase small subunit [Desulfovibrio sp.]|jgi:3-isopropylmalate/(R)-2-methylmalate dehydratase small subunit|nr:3-isopropylmalate dehydratase small subunit [Desulfovibrio sp.]